MDGYRLDLSSPPCWTPLDRLSKLLADSNSPIAINAGEFMFMGQLVSRVGPAIQLYKHRLTRAYVCLDSLGHCYRVARHGAKIRTRLERLDIALESMSDDPRPAVRVSRWSQV